jgi:DNA-binding response OmpR family regulator
MRVLLIEDDRATAQSIELMLKSESFNVYTTDLGEEGVDLGKIYDYDIILLDLNLPDMSGFEVLRSLRVSKVRAPILILSGLAGIEDKVSGLGFGADDYMTKPFHRDELVARIHAIVRRSRGHAQSVINTGDLCVNLDTKTVDISGARVAERLFVCGERRIGILGRLGVRPSRRYAADCVHRAVGSLPAGGNDVARARAQPLRRADRAMARHLPAGRTAQLPVWAASRRRQRQYDLLCR